MATATEHVAGKNGTARNGNASVGSGSNQSEPGTTSSAKRSRAATTGMMMGNSSDEGEQCRDAANHMRQQWRCDDGGVLDVPARAVPAVEHQSTSARHEQPMALSARMQQQHPKEQTPDERHEEAQADSRHGESDRKRRATLTDATTTDHLPQAKHARTGPTHAQEAQEVSSAAGERCDTTQEHSSSPRKKRSLDQWSLHSGTGSEFVGSTAAHHGAAAAAAGPSSPHEQREQREAAAASACTLAASRRTSTRDSKLVCHQGTGVKTHARTYTCARGAYKKVSTDVCDPHTSNTGVE